MFLGDINICMGRNKQLAHPNLGGPHPICWRPEENQKVDTHASKGHLPLPDCLPARILFFSSLPLDLNWNIVLPGSLACWISDWSYTLSSPGFWACWLQILELVSPRNYMNKFHIIIIINSTGFYWFCFSGENWLMQWPTQDIISHFCCSYTFSLY